MGAFVERVSRTCRYCRNLASAETLAAGLAAAPPQYHLVFKVRLQLMGILLTARAQGGTPGRGQNGGHPGHIPPFCYFRGGVEAIVANRAPMVVFSGHYEVAFGELSNPVRDAPF